MRRAAVVLAIVVPTAFLAVVNRSLEVYSAFGDSSGLPTVQRFSGTDSVPSGWTITAAGRYPWASQPQYFGVPVSWVRYRVSPRGDGEYIYADVVTTANKSSLTDHDMSSFMFRGYDQQTSERVDLGGGVYAELINYVDRVTQFQWAAVTWIWPVNYQGTTYHERVILSGGLQAWEHRASPLTPQRDVRDLFLGLLNKVGGTQSNPAISSNYEDVDVELEAAGQSLVSYALQTRTR